jgi:hypothetical protein
MNRLIYCVTCLILFVINIGHGAEYAEIRVIDGETKRSVPLVELETVNHVLYVTDNAGRVAIDDPDLIGKDVYFKVRSHGYEAKKDGFGFIGAKVTLKPGTVAEINIKRINIAERLCRLTGQGRYRDTQLLGYPLPFKESANPGNVMGQDTIQAVPYKGELYWFWGDTNRINYPLGMFRTAGAKTPKLDAKFDPAAGIAYDYFTDKTGFARAMMPLPERKDGVIWIDGLITVPDDKGVEKLICHYSRRKGLADELEHGIAMFDDATNMLLPVKELPLTERWRHLHGHPIVHELEGKKWILSGNPMLNVRVPATHKAVLNPEQYEAFTIVENAWTWQKTLPPTGSQEEAKLVKAGKLKPEQARFYPANVKDISERVILHNGTVRWNAYRKCWVMLAGQYAGKTSFLGEVWYAEADSPVGPFAKAVKVVTHDKQTFYNVCHHDFLDREGGKLIHFEGTYTSDFSGNSHKTPRYDYNQMLYRLDLDAKELKLSK